MSPIQTDLLLSTRRALVHRLATGQVQGRAPSVVAAVVRDGRPVWVDGWGSVDGRVPDGNIQYRIGSITKTFVAVLVLRLRDEGRLALTDPLAEHLPGTVAGQATLGALLAHTAGLLAEAPGRWWERTPGALRPDLADVLGSDAWVHPAGQRHHYSNPGYALLGALVERVRGQALGEVLRREVLEPLGMIRTTLLPVAPHATGWAVHPWADVLLAEPAVDTGLMAPAGQLWSTATDLARFAAFLIDGDERVLHPDTVAEMRAPTSQHGTADSLPLQRWLIFRGSSTLGWKEPHRKEPAVMSSVSLSAGPIHLGLDTSKNTIVVGILRPEEESPDVERIFNDEPSVRRLVGRFPDRGVLRVCYEAGPTGFGLYRLLRSMGVACEVIAPSLIPRAPGDRVKTDRRDCRRLARLHRAGQLVAIRVPTEAEEAVRDLCRARADMVGDRTRTRHRLSKFLLRHDRIWRGGDAWTMRHEQWLAGQRFDDAALQATYGHYRAVLVARDAELAAVEADLAHWCEHGPFAAAVARLGAYRGIARLGALSIASEVGDWRRFGTARAFMGFTGLVPSEYSCGTSTHRGRITKAGNVHLRTQLIESAWAYQHRPNLGATLRRRQERVETATVARSWKAQQRLCARFRRLSARKTSRNIVTVAIARELAGFCWAEMTATD